MLNNIAAFYRYLQLFAHIGHNKVCEATFYQDHKALGGLYEAYESAYDLLVERAIGLGMDPDLFTINAEAAKLLKEMAGDFTNQEYFQVILEGEKGACEMLEAEIKNGEHTQGTINALAQLADDSEIRQYKIGQRLKSYESES